MIRPALSTKLVTASVVKERSKPIATGSGVTCSILLAEPTVFLFGFDHDGRRSRHESPAGTALLRGTLCLNVTKNVKIKVIQLKLVGRARTEWAEGVPPLKQETFEEDVLRTQVLTFFNALNDGWETDYGSQCYFAPQNPPPSPSPYPSPSSSSMPSLPSSLSLSSSLRRPPNAVSASTKALHRSSLALAPLAASLSIGRDDLIATSTQLKGHRIFYPGTYNYSFELPIDHHQLETIKLPSGSVRWELQATIDRAGAFKANLHGAREVLVVRVPDQLSLETSEPISISRQWEDQLHYDIVVSGKSFPIGSRIPVAFRLTPLAKVRVHKIKMYVSETVEYWTSDRRVARREPGRKILLLEKTAGRPLDPAFAGSELCVLSGGETSRAERRESNRDVATLARASTSLAPLGEHTDNLLGDLDLGLEEFWGATEMEANVQLPTCVMMAKNKELRLSPDCSWKNVNVFHWIKIVLRLSRLDPDDPTGVRRRHFEISIDSPFTVLDCRATQTNLNLPQYAGADPPEPNACRRSCGCADAPYVGRGDTAVSSTYLLSSSAAIGAIHGDEPSTLTPGSYIDSRNSVAGAMSRPLRPIHLLRKPSYNPPPFDADLSPPRLSLDLSTDIFSQSTPPPNYDTVVGTPSVDGMADYFTRLALYENHNPPEDDDEGVEDHVGGAKILTILTDRGGRVNVANPRTPGSNSTNGARSAPSRSFDIARPALDLTMR